MACLAMSMLIKSGESERGQPGRDRALLLRDYAQSHMEMACNSNQITPPLAEAAVVRDVSLID